MIITVTLNEEDYLTHQLYTASKNKGLKNRRRKNWLILTGLFFLTAFFAKGKIDFYAYYFFTAGVLTLIFYPYYQSYKYKKHFKKVVAENYEYRIGKEGVVHFQPDIIEIKDITGESKINTSEISQINEIKTHYFIKIKSGESLIIPKAAVPEIFLTNAIAIFNNHNIVVNKELNWNWK